MATKTPADPPPAAPLSRRILVNVHRDQTTATPLVVWAHEFPLLEVVHGEGNVREVLPETLDEGWTPRSDPAAAHYNKTQDAPRPPSQAQGLGFAFVGDRRAEYERMAAVYGRHPEVNQPIVEHVYGRFGTGTFARVLGAPKLSDLPDEQLRELILRAGYTLPEVEKDSTPAERAAAAKAQAEFRALKTAALLKLAEDTGVELG